ncbi:Hint domain-containing protein [Hasllibacter sp. MH4015]|uniref:Hint domain-containing protein n=1 Tax=Hasllibacter sp. MH4015 TaxID=2854029 RepID=UPI001CD28C66|nr:Hint domain-containing protein [Hasllibacter sp. MH4015]
MAIQPILIFNASSFLNAAGQQGFDDDTTNSIVNGSGPFKLVEGNPTSVMIDDQETGANEPILNDGTSRPQFLDDPVELEYVQDGVTQTTTFPAGTTQVQGEFTIEFDSGYTLVAIRMTDPNSATTGDTLVNAGYALIAPPGGSVPPPYDPVTGEFILGNVTGGSNNGATPYSDIPCFVAGTLIDTPAGPRPVEDLKEGDTVTSLDHGPVRIIWAGRHYVSGADLRRAPHLAPLHFAAGSVGNAEPLRVSPQHRLMLAEAEAEVWFGTPEILAPAIAWIGQPGVRREVPEGGVTYCHFACARHEIIRASGARAETLLPTAAQADHLETMLADLTGASGDRHAAPARPIARVFEAQAFLRRRSLAA